jgi:hypothetical protein
MKEDVKALRVEVDAAIKHTQELSKKINRGTGGREVSLCITKLQEAKMWLGKVLEELGSALPPEYRDEA